MNTEKERIINAANGFTYKFVEFWNHIITYYWDKNFQDWRQNSRTFKTMEEAVDWAESFGKYEPKEIKITPEYMKAFEVPDDYYGVRGRYYGD